VEFATRRALLPCSIEDLSTITSSTFSQVYAGTFKPSIDNTVAIECLSHLFLRVWAKSVVARCLGRVMFSDLFETFDLEFGGAAPMVVLVLLMVTISFTVTALVPDLLIWSSLRHWY
jgi:hypothetical protein